MGLLDDAMNPTGTSQPTQPPAAAPSSGGSLLDQAMADTPKETATTTLDKPEPSAWEKFKTYASTLPEVQAAQSAYHGVVGTPETSDERGATTTASPEAANLGFTPKHMGYAAGNITRGVGQFLGGVVKDLVSSKTPVILPDEKDISWSDPKANTLLGKYITAPSEEQRQKALHEAEEYTNSKGAAAVGHLLNTYVHTAGEAIPLAGSFVADLIEKAEKGDVGGAVAQVAALAVAHKAQGAVEDAAGKVRTATGQAPLTEEDWANLKQDAAKATKPVAPVAPATGKTTLRPTTQTTAGVEAPITAFQQDNPNFVTRTVRSFVDPAKAREFQEEYTKPAAARQAVSTVGQSVEDQIAAHEALMNGTPRPDAISGTQTASKFNDFDEMRDAAHNTAQKTYAKADDISQRELTQWQSEVKEAQDQYKAMVDNHNKLVDEYNQSRNAADDPVEQPIVYNASEVKVPERPDTYNELRADLDKAKRDSTSSDAVVRGEAFDTGIPKAQKAIDNWFRQHQDEISPAEYQSAKTLYHNAERFGDIAQALRQPIQDGTLSAANMSQVENAMNKRAYRQGQTPDVFQRLLGDEGYKNWNDVKELFKPIKGMPKGVSLGQVGLSLLAEHVFGPLVGGELFGGMSVLRWLSNKVMFDPNFGSLLKAAVGHIKNGVKSVASGTFQLPKDILQRASELAKGLIKNERGTAAAPGMVPLTEEDEQRARSNFQPVSHDEYSDAVKSNPQAASLSEPNPNNRSFSNGNGVYYSLSPEGDLQGVVNNSGEKGALKSVMPHAIAQGAKTLDAWDTYLPKQYEKYGFQRTKSVPYDAETYGEPSDELKDSWRQQGWKDGDPYPNVQHMSLSLLDHAMGETSRPEATHKWPTPDALIEKYGEAASSAQAGFLFEDGRAAAIKSTEHDRMLGGKPTDDLRTPFVNETGAIRMRSYGVYGDRQFNLSLPETGITKDQLDQLDKWSAQMKTGKVYLEVAKPDGKTVTLEQGSPDLEKSIRSLVPIRGEMSPNGSGDSSASQEAINRQSSETSQGVKRVVVDTRSGQERPLIGVDAVDYQPKPYESVEFRGGDRDGEIIDQGRSARQYQKTTSLAQQPTEVTPPASLESKEITTRRPKAVGSDTSNAPNQHANLDAINQADEDSPSGKTQDGKPKMGYKEKMARTVSKYEGVNYTPEELKSPDKVLSKFINHVAGNLEWLYNQIPEDIRSQTRQWYDSAHEVTKSFAKDYGLSHEQVAGVVAALSPQNPWDNNIGLAKRMMDIYKNRQTFKFTPKMESKIADFKNVPTQSKAFNAMLDEIRGKSLKQVTDSDPDVQAVKRALWVRLYDEAHNPSVNDLYAPTGEVTGHSPDTRSWIGLDHMGKAMKILENGSVDNINNVMGQGHKIRNFYNNIINPNSKNGHVTIDTHATAASLLQPLGAKDTEAAHTFGNTTKGVPGAPKNSATGLQGTYPLYAEAYRRVARKLGILPRELQSVTWEGIKSLMGDEKKTPELKSRVKEIWQDVQDGKLTLAKARAMILDESGGFSKPAWMSDEEWESRGSEGDDTSFEGGK